MREGGADEAAEERVRLVRLALEFRVILAGEEERVISHLDQLRKRSVGRGAADEETFFRHLVAVFHVELVAMAMALEHFVVLINFLGQRAVDDLRRPGAEAHAAAFFADFALLIEKADDRFGGFLVELDAIRGGDAADVSREFDRRDLHAEAKAEVGNFVLARELRGADFSLDSAFAEPAGNEDAGHVIQLAIDQAQIDSAIVAGGGVGERFVDAFVSVLQFDVFADDRDPDLLLRVDDATNELPPVTEIGLVPFDMQELANELVEPFLV